MRFFLLAGILFPALCLPVHSQNQYSLPPEKNIYTHLLHQTEKKMKIEIWSDIMCPFCYIGKRRFEIALAEFAHKDEVEVVWKSFQLNPYLKDQPEKDIYGYVAEMKGQTREWSVMIHENLVQTARSLGLDYRFDKAKIVNSFDAHRVIQLAKKHNLGEEMEERLFKAYFTEGALISDHSTLIRLASEIGLKKEEAETVLSSGQFAENVRMDAQEAAGLGANGVPFFVFDRRNAVSGAQDSKVFSDILEKTYAEWKKSGSSGN